MDVRTVHQSEQATATLRSYWEALNNLSDQLAGVTSMLMLSETQSLEYAALVALCALVVDQAVTLLRLAVELGRQELSDGSTLTESFVTQSSPSIRRYSRTSDDELPF